MFEHMGKAGPALGIVLGPDVIPDLDRNVGCRRVPDGVDTQTVGQHAFGEGERFYGDVRRRFGGGGLRHHRCRTTGCTKQQGGAEEAHLCPYFWVRERLKSTAPAMAAEPMPTPSPIFASGQVFAFSTVAFAAASAWSFASLAAARISLGVSSSAAVVMGSVTSLS
ncbi:hypothetical protein SPHINGOT1_120262 [Sphingomonas sp. T1]|nr:hypothetical protein SPHINGOT1_120262 [Sphingomonas sp. T1]